MRLSLNIIVVGMLTACGSDPVPGTHASVSLNMGLKDPSTPATALAAALTASTGAGGLSLDDGTRILVVSSAEVVLREIRMESSDDDAACDDNSMALEDDEAEVDDSGDDDGEEHEGEDGCAEFRTAAQLISLPLDGSLSQAVATDVAVGSYDEIKFKIHKPEDSDSAFLAAYPDFADLSVRVAGTFDGNPFTFTSDVNDELEIELAEPLVVGSEPVALTLSIDVAGWFSDDDQMLLDPSSEDSRSTIENNIKDAFDAFEDSNEDGEDDNDSDD